MRRRVALLLCTILALAIAAPASLAAQPASAPLEAALSRNRVALDETFELVLRATGDTSGAPDLAPLERDYHVGGVNRLSRTTISNGKLSRHQEWRVQLRARSEGRFTIPPIEIPGVAGSASAPLTVEVVAAARRRGPGTATPPPATQGAPSVFVEAEVDRDTPYVQGQVLLRVRIASDRPVLSGSLTEPQVAGASVERMGDDRNYEETIGGRPHRIIEREYAIFPQQSGELRIPPISFEGRVHAPSAQRGRARPRNGRGFGGSIFDQLEGMMGDGFFAPRGLGVRAQTEELVLDVQPRPEDATGRWWLPAEHLKLSEEWDREPETLQVGEQVTRKFVIQAFGVSRDQIPEIELPEVSGVKQYPEPVSDQTVRTEDGLASIKVQKTVMIATEPGEVVLPAIEFAWWDTSEDRERIASLPERRIRVVAAGAELAGATTPRTASGDAGAAPEPKAAIPATDTSAAAESVVAASQGEKGRGLWIALFLGLVLAGSIATYALLRRRAGRSAPAPRAAEPAKQRLRNAERALARACSANDAEAAARALCEIDAARSPEASCASPGAFAERFGDATLRAAVASLQAARFSAGNDVSWSGAALGEAYGRIRRAPSERAAVVDEVLPSLYPSARPHARS